MQEQPQQPQKPKQTTNSKLSIKINTKESINSFEFNSKKITFPLGLPIQILNFEVKLMKNTGQEEQTTDNDLIKPKLTGGISGIFSCTKVKFQKPFFFKIPFSMKHRNGIAISFKTNQFQSDQLKQLNKFIFGDEDIKPIIISKDVAVQIGTSLFHHAKFLQKYKDKWDKAVEFLKTNDISLNILIDQAQRKYQIGFFWKQFNLEGKPEEIQIKDIMFGLSLQFKKDSTSVQNYQVMIGGKGQLKIDDKSSSSLYIEYSLSKNEQRIALGGTVSILTDIMQLMKIEIPQQISDFAHDMTISLEYISDPSKKILSQMKKNSQK